LVPEKIDEEAVWVSDGMLARTNPGRSGRDPEGIDLPDGIHRRQWALLTGLEAALEREGASDRVGGNTDCLWLIAGLGFVGSLVAIFVKLPAGGRSPWIILTLVLGGVVGFGLYRLHRWMLFRATYRRFGPQLRRHLRATEVPLETLQAAADVLGRPVARVRSFLSWAAERWLRPGVG
jgi:hypothetical protein